MTIKDQIPNDIYETAERLVADAMANAPDVTLSTDAQKWIAQSELHQRAFDEAVALWSDLGWATSLNDAALRVPTDDAAFNERRLLAFPAARQVPRRWLFGGISAIAATVAAIVLAPIMLKSTSIESSPHHPSSRSAPTLVAYETAVGEVRSFTLADGSEVTLGGASVLETRFSTDKRDVAFVQGDALFDVAHDSTRPFVVDAGPMDVTVIGTTFEVRRDLHRTSVGVLGGKVRVEDNENTQALYLMPGELATLESNSTLITGEFDISKAARWRDTRLSFRAEPLGAIIEETNRYYPPGIRLMSTELADITVTTSFRADQVKTALSGVAAINDLTLDQDDNGTLYLSAK